MPVSLLLLVYPLRSVSTTGTEVTRLSQSSCPACRADRDFNETMLLRGLDDFLKGVREAIQTEDERDERDEEEIPAVTVD